MWLVPRLSKYAKHAPRNYAVKWQVDAREEVFDENIIESVLCVNWIAERLSLPPYFVKNAIVLSTRVYDLRAALGIDLDAPVQEESAQQVTNRYESAA